MENPTYKIIGILMYSAGLRISEAIKNCRTSVYGSNVKICDTCDHTQISYNSCRNRHCPKCQTMAKEKWLMERQDELLPVGYFHVVFKIPSELYKVFYRSKRDLLERNSSSLLKCFQENLGETISFYKE